MNNTHTNLISLFRNIADAIRSKTGGTSPIVADNFPTEISNIETGGGEELPTGIKGIWYGSYTPSSDIVSTTGFTVTHNMGYVPTVVYCWCDTYIPIENTQSILAIVNNSKATKMFTDGGVRSQYGYVSFNNASATSGGVLSSSSYVGTQTTTTSQIKGNSSSRYFRSGVKYNILLIALE